jgi:tRNA G46 methylase TrmB
VLRQSRALQRVVRSDADVFEVYEKKKQKRRFLTRERSDPVAKVMKAAKSLRVAADEMRELEKLAEPLLPKRIVIKEEQENSAPMGDANAVPFQNSDEHDVRELLDWDEVDKVFFFF